MQLKHNKRWNFKYNTINGGLCCPRVNARDVYIFLYFDASDAAVSPLTPCPESTIIHIDLHNSKVLSKAPGCAPHIQLPGGHRQGDTIIVRQLVHGCYMFESLSDSDY